MNIFYFAMTKNMDENSWFYELFQKLAIETGYKNYNECEFSSLDASQFFKQQVCYLLSYIPILKKTPGI